MRFLFRFSLIALLAMVGAATMLSARAQERSPRAGGPDSGNFTMSPEMQKKVQAWRVWNESHHYVGELARSLQGLAGLAKDSKTPITKPEAQKILPVLLSWRNKTTMSDAQAHTVYTKLTTALTPTHLKKLQARPDSEADRSVKMKNGEIGGDKMKDGEVKEGGHFQMVDPRDYNPLNPDTLPVERGRARAKEALDGLIKDLKARAA